MTGARELLERVTVEPDVPPSPLPGVAHMLTIGVHVDAAGEVTEIHLAAATVAPVEASAVFRAVLLALTTDTTALALVSQACGIKSAMFEATGIPLCYVDDDEAT